MGGDPGQVHPPRLDLHEEEHVQPGQGDGLDGEEVAGQGPGSLSAQELHAGRSLAGALRGGAEAVAAQDGPDRGRRHGDPELAGFPDDAEIAPAWVLTRQPQHHLDRGFRQPSPAATGVRVGPVVGDQLPVPAEERGRRDQEDAPPVAGQQPGQRSQQHPIGRGVPGPGDLSPQHGELMPENGDLHVLGVRGWPQPDQAE